MDDKPRSVAAELGYLLFFLPSLPLLLVPGPIRTTAGIAAGALLVLGTVRLVNRWNGKQKPPADPP
jgi:hypothetical protein